MDDSISHRDTTGEDGLRRRRANPFHVVTRGAGKSDEPPPRVADRRDARIGTLLRVILEFSLPKDGWLLLPFAKKEFYDYGVPVKDEGTLYPNWFDVPDDEKWTPSSCPQTRFEDYTGVDSLASPLFSLVLFLLVSGIEKMKGSPLLDFGEWSEPYNKKINEDTAAAVTKA